MELFSGLTASIFKDSAYENGNDCTNNGFSSSRTRAYVFSSDPEYWGIYSEDDVTDSDYLVITEGPFGTVRAVPKSLIDNGSSPMFGGNFVYSSDSRFSKLNNGNPVKIFDRVE